MNLKNYIKQTYPNAAAQKMIAENYRTLRKNYETVIRSFSESGYQNSNANLTQQLTGLYSPSNSILIQQSSTFKSFVPLLCAERAMTQLNEQITFLNTYNIGSDKFIDMTMGRGESTGGLDNALEHTWTVSDINIKVYTVSASSKLLPGHVTLKIKHGSDTIEFKDNGKGKFLITDQWLTSSEIKYDEGSIKIEVGATMLPLTTSTTISVKAHKNVITDASDLDTLSLKFDHMNLVATPQMILSENNDIFQTIAAKQQGINIDETLAIRLREYYTKKINDHVVRTLIDNHTGDTQILDLGRFEAATEIQTYNSVIKTMVDNLHDSFKKKNDRITKGTAILASGKVCKLLRSVKNAPGDSTWVEAKNRTHVEDLTGYFDEVPVLEHRDVPADEGYLIFKAPDNTVAPIIRGTYLPLTDLPTVSDFNNPQKKKSGVYSMETITHMTPDLQIKFKIKQEPDDTFRLTNN